MVGATINWMMAKKAAIAIWVTDHVAEDRSGIRTTTLKQFGISCNPLIAIVANNLTQC